uniref:DnrO protein n=1 Tax=Dechloromonas aromatica (strain RCB) TaxID=159087 RepID=Q47H90_DECAR
MKTRLSVLLVALALAAASNIQAAEAHHHHHGGAEPAKLQLNSGKKWATDEHLRLAMNDINQAMSNALPAIHTNQFGHGDYQTLAATVSAKVGYAVEHCKLDPKADAMLHLIIAELMAGAEIMEGKSVQARHDGAVRVLEALKSYGKYFQHPGWKIAKG